LENVGLYYNLTQQKQTFVNIALLIGVDEHVVASFPTFDIKKRFRMSRAWLSLFELPVAKLLYRTRELELE
jgi:hypothetical protein